MTAKRISYSFFDRTTYLFALVFLTRLQLPTYFLALVILNILNILWAHHLKFKMFRIVKLIARHLTTIFTALADLLYHYFTTLAFFIVTFLTALMPLTRKEFLTCTCLANRNFVSTFSPFFTQQSKNLFASTWTESYSRRYLLAWLTLTLMTYFLAIVLPTVQLFVANVITDKFLASTLNLSLFFLAETLNRNINTALIAFSLVTLLFAFMFKAV